MIKLLNVSDTREFVSKYDSATDASEQTVFVLGVLDSAAAGYLMDKLSTFSFESVEVDSDDDDEKKDKSGDKKVVGNKTIGNMPMNRTAMETCQLGLRGWRNLKDDSGDILFKTEKMYIGQKKYQAVRMDLLRRIPLAVLKELADEITKDNLLLEPEEVKN
jgi:hypothetical protein